VSAITDGKKQRGGNNEQEAIVRGSFFAFSPYSDGSRRNKGQRESSQLPGVQTREHDFLRVNPVPIDFK
jgi:hypothetical protein